MSDAPQGPGWWRATAVVLVALLGGCSSSSAAAPNPLDVSAAKACEQVTVWLGSHGTDTASHDALVVASTDLTAGAAEAVASSTAPPKYAGLGTAIFDLLGADVAQDDPKFSSAGDTIATECGKIPAGAKTAGGYTK